MSIDRVLFKVFTLQTKNVAGANVLGVFGMSVVYIARLWENIPRPSTGSDGPAPALKMALQFEQIRL